jgi:kynureninase
MSLPTPAELDSQDPLAAFRDRFVIDDPDLTYLDGNSLGRLPAETARALREFVDQQWGAGLIRSWNEHWMEQAVRIGTKVSDLVGATPDEVAMADSTSVNLFKLVVAALRARPERHRIVTDALNFPSDVYVLQSAIELMGEDYELEIVPSADGMTVAADDLAAAIDERTALVELSHTTFKSGYVHDLQRVTDIAHRSGALILWDLSHSVGAMPISLGDANADLAVGCTYKYLNGGPGSPAFLYVRRELIDTLSNPVAGWFGQRNPFEFDLDYQPAAGIKRFLTGTPTMLSLAATEPGIDLVLEAGLDRIREKSVAQTEYLLALYRAHLERLGFALNSPEDPDARGSHVSLGHPEGLRIARALIDRMGVIPDFRAPDNIRLGVAPLYTSYAEVHHAVIALEELVRDRLYERYSAEIGEVT